MKVRFVWLSKEIDVVKTMKCPKKVENRDAWLVSARKAVSDIPATTPPSTWAISFFDATLKRVVFELSNNKDKHARGYDFCHVIIDREASSLG